MLCASCVGRASLSLLTAVAALKLSSRSAVNARARALHSFSAAISCNAAFCDGNVTRVAVGATACCLLGPKTVVLASAAVSSASLVNSGVDWPLVMIDERAEMPSAPDAVVVTASSSVALDALALATRPPAAPVAVADTLLHVHFRTAQASLQTSVMASL